MAWKFNGTTQYARLLDFDGYSLGSLPDTGWATGIYFKRRVDPASPQGILTAGVGGYNFVRLETDGGVVGSIHDDSGNDSGNLDTPYIGEEDVWHVAVVGADASGNGFIALDGVVDTGSTANILGNVPAWLVGAIIGDLSNPPAVEGGYFDGSMAEWWCIDRPVTVGELELLANFGRLPEEMFADNFKFHFRMNEASGNGVTSAGTLDSAIELVAPAGYTNETHPVTRPTLAAGVSAPEVPSGDDLSDYDPAWVNPGDTNVTQSGNLLVPVANDLMAVYLHELGNVNQRVYLDGFVYNGNADFIGAMCRSSADFASFYSAEFSPAGGGNVKITKSGEEKAGGGFTFSFSKHASCTLDVQDVDGQAVITATFFYNGAQKTLTWTDPAPLTSTKGGFMAFDGSGGTAAKVAYINASVYTGGGGGGPTVEDVEEVYDTYTGWLNKIPTCSELRQRQATFEGLLAETEDGEVALDAGLVLCGDLATHPLSNAAHKELSAGLAAAFTVLL